MTIDIREITNDAKAFADAMRRSDDANSTEAKYDGRDPVQTEKSFLRKSIEFVGYFFISPSTIRALSIADSYATYVGLAATFPVVAPVVCGAAGLIIAGGYIKDATRIFGINKLDKEIKELFDIKRANAQQQKLLSILPNKKDLDILQKKIQQYNSKFAITTEKEITNEKFSGYEKYDSIYDTLSVLSKITEMIGGGFRAIARVALSFASGADALSERKIYDLNIATLKNNIDVCKKDIGLWYKNGESIIEIKKYRNHKDAENYAISRIARGCNKIEDFESLLFSYKEKHSVSQSSTWENIKTFTKSLLWDSVICGFARHNIEKKMSPNKHPFFNNHKKEWEKVDGGTLHHTSKISLSQDVSQKVTQNQQSVPYIKNLTMHPSIGIKREAHELVTESIEKYITDSSQKQSYNHIQEQVWGRRDNKINSKHPKVRIL